MASTTMGVKLNEEIRERLKNAAGKIDRTPHWLIKQAIFSMLEQIEAGHSPHPSPDESPISSREESEILTVTSQPFIEFAEQILPQSVLRSAITAATRRPEPDMVSMMLEQARMPPVMADKVHDLAYVLTEKLRNRKNSSGRAGVVQGLLQEFSLSSQEGVALMCLAEALLRIPDKSTRDALIRDKVSNGNWHSHLGHSNSMFVNAATWGLLVTGLLVSTHNQANLSKSLNRMIAKGGEPLVRKAIDMAMRLMGEQFVTGESIAQALANARRSEAKGFRYSYDMLGEAALTANDAHAYFISYQQAITAIGKASNGRGIYEGPGISIKLSALHPRYQRSQYERVMQALYPQLKALVLQARNYDIGINIDAEEADRLELSLDLLEKLCHEPEFEGWNGIGFVIQAYQKRCPFVIDYLTDLASRSRRRLMIRLVKGAYWDSEIKRAQIDGLEGYPVYTRKAHTDVSYLACARKLLSVPNLIYPQFATHNAHTLAAVYQLAGNNYYPGQYEFQCLHGMGEPLYEQVVGNSAEGKLNRPCRIYAPVGTHETLLAYLVRRLLENGANTSFVNRVSDKNMSLEALIIDPVKAIEKQGQEEGKTGLPHPRIPLPASIYGKARVNSAGIDMANEHRLASLSTALLNSAGAARLARPMPELDISGSQPSPVCNPAQREDIVGHVVLANDDNVAQALQASIDAYPIWFATPPVERAAILTRAALLMEGKIQLLIGILVREAGKTYANAIAEVREAVDFLRYYAAQVAQHFDNETHRPLGVVVCISPWNFPLAIFTGQIAAALAAGNSVIAKPAEQTPLVASEAIQLLYEAGVPEEVLHFLPGNGEQVGAKLVADERVSGVMFTGSTPVAASIGRVLAKRLDSRGKPIPLIAETGGINAMIVDSSALTEQVVVDIVASAFDSAGQRCSALRLLCIQEEVADRTLTMLMGAMAEYRLGNPENLATDIGPVIDAEARDMMEQHIAEMRNRGLKVSRLAFLDQHQASLLQQGTYVKPTLIELNEPEELQHEIFGPVLHVVRYRSADLGQMISKINQLGYGLTFGVHTRIDETIKTVTDKVAAGNLYVNRNMVGAVVGVQPFGGESLSGTGPKAGGPLYLLRLLATRPAHAAQENLAHQGGSTTLMTASDAVMLARNEFKQWLGNHDRQLLPLLSQYERDTISFKTLDLVGPTGESNRYQLTPRTAILCLANLESDRLVQLAAIIAVGTKAIWPDEESYRHFYKSLPQSVADRIELQKNVMEADFDGVLFHGDADKLQAVAQSIAARSGPIITIQGFSQGETDLQLERLLIERSISVNTAAAGGNASLMTIG